MEQDELEAEITNELEQSDSEVEWVVYSAPLTQVNDELNEEGELVEEDFGYDESNDEFVEEQDETSLSSDDEFGADNQDYEYDEQDENNYWRQKYS